MSGSLQTKIYGGQRHSSAGVKKMGLYNGSALKRMGHYNGPVKRMGVDNGIGGGKININMEMYPHP